MGNHLPRFAAFESASLCIGVRSSCQAKVSPANQTTISNPASVGLLRRSKIFQHSKQTDSSIRVNLLSFFDDNTSDERKVSTIGKKLNRSHIDFVSSINNLFGHAAT